jgi:photosystem II stability/assembly factor-like uncharacterized protein
MSDNNRVKCCLPLALILLSTACSLHTLHLRPAQPPHQTGEEQEPHDGAAEYAAFQLARRSADRTPIPYARYVAAHQKADRMPSRRHSLASSSTGLSAWTSLGPNNVSGMSRSLVIDPTNPATMYTTGINGGVWKSTDSGATWNPRGDFLPLLVIGSLAMSPSDNNTLYAGTGDGFIGFDSISGAGIFKTSDAGDTWTSLDATTADKNFTFINKIAVSPNNPSTVYAATNAGVLRSDDAGVSWTLILDRGLPHRGCHDLTIRTDRPTDVMLASCGIPATRTNGALLNKVDPLDDGTLPATVFQNLDAANNDSPWNAVLADPNMGRTSLAAAPSNQDIVYASASALSGTFAFQLLAVYRSEDGGSTWTTVTTNQSTNPINRALLSYATNAICSSRPSYSGQAWHDNAIAVDPVDSNRLWIGGVDLFRSDDGGANWSVGSYWWAPSSAAQYAHADQHVILFHPNYDGASNQTMFAVNDGGIFRTDNARAALPSNRTAPCGIQGDIQWRPASTGLATLEFYHGSVLPEGRGYFGGAQDNGTVLGTEAAGPNAWTAIGGGDGGPTAIDPTNPNILYISSNSGNIQKSVNGGRTFSSVMGTVSESSNNFFLISPFAMDPNNSSHLWMGGNTIWRTIDAGTIWTPASAPLVPDSYGAFAIAPGDSNQVLAGSRTGEIFRSSSALSTNDGTVWDHATPRIGWVSALVYDPVAPSTVYAVYSSFNRDPGDAHIYKSLDGGVTWSSSDGYGGSALPDAPYFTLAIHPDRPSTIWVAGDLGLFVSTDAGATWSRENAAYPYVSTNHLTIQRDSQGLAMYAFTHGRGLWRARIGGAASAGQSVRR